MAKEIKYITKFYCDGREIKTINGRFIATRTVHIVGVDGKELQLVSVADWICEEENVIIRKVTLKTE